MLSLRSERNLRERKGSAHILKWVHPKIYYPRRVGGIQVQSRSRDDFSSPLSRLEPCLLAHPVLHHFTAQKFCLSWFGTGLGKLDDGRRIEMILKDIEALSVVNFFHFDFKS